MRVLVLVSGGGTNLQAIIDGVADGTITNTEIVGVLSNNYGVYSLERAEKAGKVFGARYLEKHKLLLEIMKEGAETVWSLSQIYSFLLKIENDPSLKQEIAAKLDNIKEDHITIICKHRLQLISLLNNLFF